MRLTLNTDVSLKANVNLKWPGGRLDWDENNFSLNLDYDDEIDDINEWQANNAEFSEIKECEYLDYNLDENEYNEVELHIPFKDHHLTQLIIETDTTKLVVNEFLNQIEVTFPLTNIASMPFEIMPFDGDEDLLVNDDEIIVGYIYKFVEDYSPYDQLKGLETSIEWPHIAQPIYPPVNVENLDILTFFNETLNLNTIETIEEKFKQDFLGIIDHDMNMLLSGIATALEYVIDEYDIDLPDDFSILEDDHEELDNFRFILAGCLFIGSRIARTSYARKGKDTSLTITVSPMKIKTLLKTSSQKLEAFWNMAQGTRMAGVYCFDFAENREVENYILAAIDGFKWDIIPADIIFFWASWIFELAVRYQTIRVNEDELEAHLSNKENTI